MVYIVIHLFIPIWFRMAKQLGECYVQNLRDKHQGSVASHLLMKNGSFEKVTSFFGTTVQRTFQLGRFKLLRSQN